MQVSDISQGLFTLNSVLWGYRDEQSN